jgi:hypothetical protein
VVAEMVAYDEHENGEGNPAHICCLSAMLPEPPIVLPSTSLVPLSEREVFGQSIFDQRSAGWAYLNLDTLDGHHAQQNWVIVSMRAQTRLSVDFDAAPLGNGCSPAPELTRYDPNEGFDSLLVPGPLPDVNP